MELESKLGDGTPQAPAQQQQQQPPKKVVTEAPPPSAPPAPKPAQILGVISEDPTPSPRDLPRKPAVSAAPAPPAPEPAAAPNIKDLMKKQSRYDTVVHFAAVEMGGTLQKKPLRGP